MSKQLRLDVAQLTDVGRKRPHNEDNMAYVIPKDPQALARKGALFIVADGMGGHAAGEVASEIAVDTVSKVYYQDDSDDIAGSLLHAIKRANSLIHQRAAENMLRSGMGTTCVAAVLRGSTAYIANVGDSRAYLIRGNTVKQISQDHSWVEEQVRAGLLTRDQARSHAQRNVITRSLGTQPEVEIDIFGEDLRESDLFILCSDGLSGLVDDEDLSTIVNQHMPQESVYHLVERANENGGPDNITAIVVQVQELGWEPPGARRPLPVNGQLVGHAADEDTAVLSKLPGPAFSLPIRTDDGRVMAPSMRRASGPLVSTEREVPPTPMPLAPAVAKPEERASRRRLLYPTLALITLLLVSLVGVGSYYFLNLSSTPVDIGASLNEVNATIAQANKEVTANPAEALKQLSEAQKKLGVIQKQNASMDAAQQTQLDQVQKQLVATVNSAITTYNQQMGITPLSCLPAPTANVSSGSVGPVSTLAVITGDKGRPFSFTVAADERIYRLSDQQMLVDKTDLPDNPAVKLLVGDGQRMLALAKKESEYRLYILTADENGKLRETGATNIDPGLLKKDGREPRFLAAWGSDVYLVLTPSTKPNSATVLQLNADKLSEKPKETTLSISVDLVHVTAFPDKQLFLVFGNGNVHSLQLDGKQKAASAVIVRSTIPTPLPVDSGQFVATTPVPVPTPSTVPNTQALTFLSVPGATLLAAGMVDGKPHLFLVDTIHHRILDLMLQEKTGSAATPAATSTPNPSATPSATAVATPTSTPTGTTGGGVATPGSQGQAVTMQLQRQYASAELLPAVKSLVADPKDAVLHLLTQGDVNDSTRMRNLLSINLNQNSACTA